MSPSLRFYTIDAFTKLPFAGNQAAVIVLDDSADHDNIAQDEPLCQRIAQEFHLSETAFAKPLPGGTESQPKYLLRWWTPTYEIPLCGHGSLATAAVLFTHYHPKAESIHFETKKRGHLIARRNSEDSSISLDFPRGSLVSLSEGHRRLPKITTAVERFIRKEQIMRVDWSDEIGAYCVEISQDIDLPSLEVDVPGLLALKEEVILTQPAPPSSGFDIYSRVFRPDAEVPEDPVTGSAHTALAPFWFSSPSLERLHNPSKVKETSTLRAKQVSKRGGELMVKFDEKNRRVELTGFAREMMKGELSL
ncbi:hypothetical protein JCM5353_006511 [Sporobolomyces roseus]